MTETKKTYKELEKELGVEKKRVCRLKVMNKNLRLKITRVPSLQYRLKVSKGMVLDFMWAIRCPDDEHSGRSTTQISLYEFWEWVAKQQKWFRLNWKK